MDEWHIHVGGQNVGNATTAQILELLHDGRLAPVDLVWRQGMTNWVPLSTIPEFGGEPAPPLPDDPGPFLRVGTTFYLNSREWVGRTIASPTALYLLKGRSLQGIHVGHGLATTAIMVTAGLIAQSRWPEIRSCQVAELPPNVRVQLDPKGKKAMAAVVVVRRGSVKFVKVPRIYNVIRFDLAGQRVSLVTSWFGVRKVGRWLAQHGWLLNQPLQPTDAPVKGADFQRR